MEKGTRSWVILVSLGIFPPKSMCHVTIRSWVVSMKSVKFLQRHSPRLIPHLWRCRTDAKYGWGTDTVQHFLWLSKEN